MNIYYILGTYKICFVFSNSLISVLVEMIEQEIRQMKKERIIKETEYTDI